MPTTSNFGWTTPADTDLVKDGAAAIRTLGNGIDSSFIDLKGGTTGQVLSKASNTDLDFSWVAQDDSNAIQNALLTTTGDTIYASAASTPARLGIGSTGQVLTVAGGVPTWATPAGGGKVLQVVQSTYSTATTTTSTTWADTGLSVSITPASASNKVLILTSQSFYIRKGLNPDTSDNAGGGFRLMRGSTQIFGSGQANQPYTHYMQIEGANGVAWYTYYSFSYLDSPSTTSSTTYKTQQAVNDATSGSAITAQTDSFISSIIALEIGA